MPPWRLPGNEDSQGKAPKRLTLENIGRERSAQTELTSLLGSGLGAHRPNNQDLIVEYHTKCFSGRVMKKCGKRRRCIEHAPWKVTGQRYSADIDIKVLDRQLQVCIGTGLIAFAGGPDDTDVTIVEVCYPAHGQVCSSLSHPPRFSVWTRGVQLGLRPEFFLIM